MMGEQLFALAPMARRWANPALRSSASWALRLNGMNRVIILPSFFGDATRFAVCLACFSLFVLLRFPQTTRNLDLDTARLVLAFFLSFFLSSWFNYQLYSPRGCEKKTRESFFSLALMGITDKPECTTSQGLSLAHRIVPNTVRLL